MQALFSLLLNFSAVFWRLEPEGITNVVNYLAHCVKRFAQHAFFLWQHLETGSELHLQAAMPMAEPTTRPIPMPLTKLTEHISLSPFGILRF